MNEIIVKLDASDLMNAIKELKPELQEMLDVLRNNEEFHRKRDEMNGAVHLAREVRYSPLTIETISARERLEKILE